MTAVQYLTLSDVCVPNDEADRNRARQRGDVHVDECFRCGRGLTASALEKAWMVHMHTGGVLVPADAELDSADDQGWFPLGSECAKHVPREYRAKELR